MKSIRITGAREHNLKNISLEIPRDKLVVITGLSGSGKSSLAFDTIYAEGQRRYVESLSAYARQFLGQLEKPDVDAIEGLSPAISIEQKTTSRNPRSTVGTVTEIYDYLRVLFARLGEPHCPGCGAKLVAQTIDTMVAHVLGIFQRNANLKSVRVQVLSPIARSKKGEFRDVFERLAREGFVRVRVDGRILSLDEPIVLKKNLKHDIDIVVDRLILERGQEQSQRMHLAGSLELALRYAAAGSQAAVLYETTDGQAFEENFSSKLYCTHCDRNFPEITHRLFSFNSPEGACEHCSGLGHLLEFHPDKLIRDDHQTVAEGLGDGLGFSADAYWYRATIEALRRKVPFNPDTPWRKLPKKIFDLLLYGDKNLKLQYEWKGGDSTYQFSRGFEGIIPNLHRRYLQTQSETMRQKMEQYMEEMPCPVCQGKRLKPEALAVRLKGKNIAETTALTIEEAERHFRGMQFTPTEAEIAQQAMKEILSRLHFLNSVGVGYLTLDRMAGTLSGGEAQRIRLATQIGSALVGVLYVLDEPSIGLHQSDNAKLIATLKRLRDLGNTVLVVEHDEETMQAADFIVDMGPGAGRHGGQVVFAGSYPQILKAKNSITADYLSGRRQIAIPAVRRKPSGTAIRILGAAENNLKDIDVEIPLSVFTVVTGLSGSGKSSLIHEILYKAASRKLMGTNEVPGKHRAIEGLEHIDKVINIDQSPIGRTPRSNPATYTGAFTPIRELFATLPASQMRGFKPGRFSFNVEGGRCEACAGDGVKRIEMHFLSDVYVKCEVCQGKRYNQETLEVRFKNKNIYDVLEMTVEEALEFFSAFPAIVVKLKALYDVGLGYIKLGQPATTLSGGEAQRVKLATELSRRSTGRTLYLLDEPTTGLHFEDIRILLGVLQRFVDEGNTVVVIEHNMDVIKCADYIIDLGPEGGARGGEIVATGTPEEIAANPRSLTGQYLKRWLTQKTPKAS
ncbi:MAG: excinuclease ABC subunit UvrA [Leptospiraceae bacterium]|nr:excinuclease ABC subunit UvrA [Leptospiraceae bacterium]